MESDLTESTFIQVPATVLKKRGFHGGLYQKFGAFNAESFFEAEGDTYTPTYEYLRASSLGLYAGVKSSTVTNITIKDDQYGRSHQSIAYDFSIDAIIAPFNRFTDRDTNAIETNVTADLKANSTEIPIGFRVAFSMYQTEKKEWTGKKFGMSATGEIGYKPYFGYFLNAGIGITFVKQRHWTPRSKE